MAVASSLEPHRDVRGWKVVPKQILQLQNRGRVGNFRHALARQLHVLVLVLLYRLKSELCTNRFGVHNSPFHAVRAPKLYQKYVILSRFVRVILAQGPC